VPRGSPSRSDIWKEEKPFLVIIGSYNIELVPATTWGKSLAQLARQKGSGFRSMWNKIRQRELDRVKHACEICKAAVSGLICHEKWRYDDTQHVQRLVGYEVVCRECSNILHLGRASRDQRLWKSAEIHFTRATGLKADVLKDIFHQVMKEWKERSKYKWNIDISYEPLAIGFEDSLNNLQPTSEQERRWQGP